MKKGIKKKWLAALRSGNYNKGKRALRKKKLLGDHETYCCIGVLCDLRDPTKWDGALKIDCYYYDGMAGVPGGEFLHWSGIKNAEMNDLICLNDNRETWRSVIK